MGPTDSRSDVVIVGAGPAGAYLAFLLARMGIAVTVIDKSAFPRDKVCGGGLSRKAMNLLDLDFSSVVQRTIRGAVLAYGLEEAIVKDIDPPVAVMVLRSEFDQLLLDNAIAQGARFIPGAACEDVVDDGDVVTVRSNRGNFACSQVFAADGAGSLVRESLFGRRSVEYVPAVEALVEIDPARLERFDNRVLFDFAAVPNGYGWVFPKGDHANVGVYSPTQRKDLKRSLERFIDSLLSLKGASRIRYLGSVIPICNRSGQYQRGRVALLGDAAGMAEAIFGEGIYFALASAVLAAQAVAEEGIDRPGRRYSELVRERLEPELRAARQIARLIYRFPHFTFRRLVVNDSVNRDFAGLLTGETGYRQCLRQTLLTAPRWLLAKKRPRQPHGL